MGVCNNQLLFWPDRSTHANVVFTLIQTNKSKYSNKINQTHWALNEVGCSKRAGGYVVWGSAVFVLGRVRASGWGWRMPLTWAGCSVAPEKLLLPERSDSAQLILLATCGAPTESGAGARAPSHPRTRELRASGCIRCTHAALHPIPSKETRIDCIQQWLCRKGNRFQYFFSQARTILWPQLLLSFRENFSISRKRNELH